LAPIIIIHWIRVENPKVLLDPPIMQVEE